MKCAGKCENYINMIKGIYDGHITGQRLEDLVCKPNYSLNYQSGGSGIGMDNFRISMLHLINCTIFRLACVPT